MGVHLYPPPPIHRLQASGYPLWESRKISETENATFKIDHSTCKFWFNVWIIYCDICGGSGGQAGEE